MGAPKCPEVLIKAVTETDKKGGLLGLLSDGIKISNCTENHLNPKNVPFNSKQVEENFGMYASTKLDERPVDFISKCLDGKTISEDDKKGIIGDYYWAMNRLTQQAKADLEAITSIDLTLGKTGETMHWNGTDPKTRGWVYSTDLLPGSKKWQAQLKQCPAQKVNPQSGRTEGMEQMITQTQSALYAIYKLQQQRESLPTTTIYPPGAGMGPSMPYKGIDEGSKEYKAWQTSMEMIKNTAPWLKGDEGKRLLEIMNDKSGKYAALPGVFYPGKTGRDLVAGILEKQLYANRRGVHSQIQDLAKGAQCLAQPASSAGCLNDQVKKTFEKLSPWDPWQKIAPTEVDATGQPVEWKNLPKADKDRMMWTRSYMADAQCRYDQRGNKQAVADAGFDLGLNVGITLATAGLGAVLSAGKAAITAGRAVQLSRMAVLARAALIGVDIGFLGVGGKKAIETCDKALEGNLMAHPELTQITDTPSCTNSSDQAQLVTDLKECYVQAAMVGVGALVAIPGNIALFKGIKTPTDRLKALGYSDEATQDVVKGLASAEKTPFSLSRWARNVPERNNLVLDTIEQMGPDFAKTVNTPAHRQAFGEALGEMQHYWGNEWKPANAAKFMKDVMSNKEEGLSAVSTAFKEADTLLAKTPSLGKMGAVDAYLESLHMPKEDKEKLLGCIGAAFK